MGGASRDLQEVVGPFYSSVAGPAGVVPVEDLVGPGDEGVDDVVELGKPAGLVEVAEPVEGGKGGIMVVCVVEASELL